MSPGGVVWHKQSDPRELTMLLWMTLAAGGAGAMFWQYRPEYLSFEGPGYNLVALDGEPTARFRAAAEAIGQIEGLADHLPLTCPRAEVGIVYHPKSQELFTYNDQDDRFLADLRGVYRTLWTHGIPADIITPEMDWSGYRLLFLPNVALMDTRTRERIEYTRAESPQTRLVAEGSFGLYSADGQSSYWPPEGFAAAFGRAGGGLLARDRIRHCPGAQYSRDALRSGDDYYGVRLRCARTARRDDATGLDWC